MRIAFCNLGCKVNQFDVAAMQADFLETNGSYEIVPFEETADVYVVNTCSVTGKSDYEARQWVRRAARTNPNAKVVVTGCYAQTHPQEIAAMEGVSLVLGNQEKLKLTEYLNEYERLSSTSSSSLPSRRPLIAVGDIRREARVLEQRPISKFPFKTRAFFKVQDGCNSRCSFCIIPMSRGRSRSLSLEEAVHQAVLFDEQGYQEVILTGIHLGSYGRDLSAKISLAHLVREILHRTRIPRIRISSIEPREVTAEFLEVMEESDRICKHLHIPLQSGDDNILKAMNRNYSAGYYKDLILSISGRFGPDLGLGADVMAGFPGEGEKQFESTFNLLSSLPFTYLHVFPYSERPGTEAAQRKDDVHQTVKQKRVVQLRMLSNKKAESFLAKWIGRITKVLLEENNPFKPGSFSGYNDHYLRILVQPGSTDFSRSVNEIVKVRINGMLKNEGQHPVGVASFQSLDIPVASIQ